MESGLKSELLKGSLNKDKINKNISICFKEEEIKNNSFVNAINSSQNLKMQEKNFEKGDNMEINYKEEQFKKIDKNLKIKKLTI
jgi:hypothetical protein